MALPSRFTRRALLAGAALLSTSYVAVIAYRYYHPHSLQKSSKDSLSEQPSSLSPSLKPAPLTSKVPPGSYSLTLSTSLHCESCVKSVTTALQSLPGADNISCSLDSQLVTVVGSAPPSAVIRKVQETGRAAILRGSGRMGDGGAGVCILEIPVGSEKRREAMAGGKDSPIRGLIRFVQLEVLHADEKQTQPPSEEAKSDIRTLLDLTLTGLEKGRYKVQLHATGDVSSPPTSLGPPIKSTPGKSSSLGDLNIDHSGRGELVSEVTWPVWEMVGRGISVQQIASNKDEDAVPSMVNDGERDAQEAKAGLVVGVVARSAGVWENEKVVCGCSGKTVWQEREEMLSQGVT